MQTPTKKTPVSKCINLARFAETMFSKFPKNPALTALTATLAAARGTLTASQDAYAKAISEIVHTRAEVRFADYIADKGVRSAIRAAEDADGRKNGKIVSMLAPQGITPIIKPVGATQVKEMHDLEGRLEAAAGAWAGALATRAEITTLRTNYEAALENRRAATQKASNARATRDAAKEDFLDVYAEITARVKAEFPRDRPMQDLFFDAVSEDGAPAEDAGDDDDDAAATPAAPPEEAPRPS